MGCGINLYGFGLVWFGLGLNANLNTLFLQRLIFLGLIIK